MLTNIQLWFRNVFCINNNKIGPNMQYKDVR